MLKGQKRLLTASPDRRFESTRRSGGVTALNLDHDIEFYWPLPSVEEQALLKHIHMNYRLSNYGKVMELLEKHYCSGQYETVVEFLEAPECTNNESWSDIAAAQAAMYAYLCHCHFPMSTGCPTDYLPLQRTTCLTQSEQAFFNAEIEQLNRRDRARALFTILTKMRAANDVVIDTNLAYEMYSLVGLERDREEDFHRDPIASAPQIPRDTTSE